MIKSFGDKDTERLFSDRVVKDFQGFARRAKRKLEAIRWKQIWLSLLFKIQRT